MDPVAQNQCMIYRGSPRDASAKHYIRQTRCELQCVYVKDPAMVAGLGSHLRLQEFDVATEMRR